MPYTKRTIKGLTHIRTWTEKSDDRATPYKVYMKLSILEMEKYWKNKEKEIALERLRILEERFTEIEKEKQETLASLDQPDAIRSSRSIRRQEEPAEPAPSAGTFRIRY